MVALKNILPELDDLPDVMVSGVNDDSRAINSGDAFIAVAGDVSDGHDHAAAAVARGAAVVLAERPVADCAVPVVVVPELKRQRSAIAARMLDDPSRQLHLAGITGTNGKTSVAYYLAELAGGLGHACGYLGTIGWGLPEDLQQGVLTTDSAINTQQRLRSLLDLGARWVAMEVSSHALDQDRVAAVQFDVGVFTNLSRDHLDYHGSLEAYGAAKARLFEMVPAAVINSDDEFGARLIEMTSAADVLSYGRQGDVRWRDLVFHDRGVSGVWHTPWGSAQFTLPLFGEIAVANLSAVLTVLCLAGESLDAVVELAGGIKPVPGRVEFFRGPADQPTANVVVDYAHTPDALEKVLLTLRPHVSGRLICVIGCGGDRDAGKRPMMAAAAEAGADLVWLTSDNPRGEDPQSIIGDMTRGLRGTGDVRQCVDRREAIIAAFAETAADDLLLVAGKGHEDYQEVAGQRLPFSDRELVRDLLSTSSGPQSSTQEAHC